MARSMEAAARLLVVRGKIVGTPAAARHHRVYAWHGLHERADQRVAERFLQLAAGQGPVAVLPAAPALPALGWRLGGDVGPRSVLYADAADPLAALAHARLSRAMAGRSRLLPHAVLPGANRQSRPAHRRGCARIRRRQRQSVHRA